MPTLEEMRAEINRLLPTIETPQFVKNIQTAYQNMPGAAIPQAALSLGSSMIGAPLGAAYGVASNILSDKFGTQEGIKLGQQKAGEVMNALRYTPPTKAGRDIAQAVERLPQTLTGSEMGIGMLPEIWGMPPRISPSDVQVLGARGINTAREIADIPRDFSAAQSGLTRIGAYDQPTYGARLQNVVEDIGDVMARRQARRSEDVSPILSGFETFMPETNLYAIKPKGGNWPTTLARQDLPLKEQGQLGRYLSESMPVPEQVWYDNLSNENRSQFREFVRDKGLSGRFADSFYRDPTGFKDIIEEFVNKEHRLREEILQQAPGAEFGLLRNIPTLDEVATKVKAYNEWILGPHKNYITKQMATGVETDPILKAIEETRINPFVEFVPEQDTTKGAIRKRKESLEEIESFQGKQRRQQLMEENYPHLRKDQNDYYQFDPKEYQYVGKQTAQTDLGKAYEDLLDTQLFNLEYKYGPEPYGINVEDFPFTSKLKKGTPVYDPVYGESLARRSGIAEIKNEVLKRILNDELSIDKLKNVSMDSIVRDMIKKKLDEEKYKTTSKKEADAWRMANHETLEPETRFVDAEGNPNGVKMFRFDSTMLDSNPDIVARNISQDTKDLDVCVGAGYRNTTDYKSFAPLVEPHTGKPPRGATTQNESSHAKHYLDKIKKGEMDYFSLRDADGNTQASIETNPYYGDTQMIVVNQIKGKSNGEISSNYIPYIQTWLNKHAGEIANHPHDMNNIPGIIDMGHETPSTIAYRYPSIDEDALKNTIADIIQSKEQTSPGVYDLYSKGYINPWEMILDEIPRFATTEDLHKAIKKWKSGGDALVNVIKDMEPEPREVVNQNQPRNELSPVIRTELINGMAHYFDNPNDRDFQVPPGEALQLIRILAGDQDRANAQLPPDMHERIVSWLLSPRQYAENIINTINILQRNPADFGLNESQGENLLNILTNWTERFPLP